MEMTSIAAAVHAAHGALRNGSRAGVAARSGRSLICGKNAAETVPERAKRAENQVQ
jgi:hypothetical protein